MYKYWFIAVLFVFAVSSCQQRAYCPDINKKEEAHDYKGKKNKTSKNGIVQKKRPKRMGK